MPLPEGKCQFCGATSGLNYLEYEHAWVCNKCWEVLIEIVKRFLSAQRAIQEIEEHGIKNP